jgi:hypothetical protein
LLETNSECALSLAEIDSISDYYNYVFVFYDDYILMLNQLHNKEYSVFVELYIRLIDTYFENKIDKLNFEFPPLYEFVKMQNITELTKIAAWYFVGKQEYAIAFEYLELLKLEGEESATTKDLQLKLGTDFSQALKNADASKSKAEEMSRGNKWYKYFIKAMN